MTRDCRSVVRAVSLSFVVVAVYPPSTRAQEPQPAATPEPAASPAAPPAKVQVTAFVDTYYEYNFNKVDPSLRAFDVQHNTFSLSLAEVAFTKAPAADSPVGFRADLDFGKTADLVASYEPASDGKEIYKHIQQAYVSLLTGKVQWDAGKFVTATGAEVIESQDNWNYTRSVLFGFAIPYYHVGVRATYNATPKVAIGAQLLNGWNNSSEINGNKTVELGLTLKPNEKVSWVGNYMAGKETPGSDKIRNLFDTTLTLNATAKLSFMGNFDYGQEGDTRWWGIAAYGKYQLRPSWALVGRYEYLDDTQGGFMTFGTKAQEVTITSDHTIAGALKARLEYRTDFADAAIFASDSGAKKRSQTTLAIGLVYTFGGAF
ncbi:MAG TPA: porin [Vicinamibacteria bacterium]|nr:porin [Vicinamibacteria bacterium]